MKNIENKEYWLFKNPMSNEWSLIVDVISDDKCYHGKCIWASYEDKYGVGALQRSYTPEGYNFTWMKNIEACSERKIDFAVALTYML